VLVTHDLDEAVRLGDRIAVLSDGGVLEQYDTPADLLARPATAMVRDFVGADRGVRRLAVTPLKDDVRRLTGEHQVKGLPTVPLSGTRYDALAAMLTVDSLHVAVEDNGTVVGTVSRSAIFESPAKASVSSGVD
jgi:osmoprotectant transport system ATP-binding protein